MRKCPECENMVPEDAVVCPECGYPFSAEAGSCEDAGSGNDQQTDETPTERIEPVQEGGNSVSTPVESSEEETPATVEGPASDECPAADEGSMTNERDENIAESRAALDGEPDSDDEGAVDATEAMQSGMDTKDGSSAKDKLQLFLKNKKAMAIAGGALAVVILVSVLFSTHIICFHENWVAASCEEPKHCADCGKTEGDALGHEWTEATCTEPKTCMRCGKVKGEAAGHKAEGWSEPIVNVVAAEENSVLKCTVCGEVVDSKSTTLESFIKDGKFIFSPSDFCQRLKQEVDMDVIYGDDPNLISYALVDSISSREMCGMLSFSSMDGQTNLGDSFKHDSTCNPSPVFIVDTEKCNSAEMMIGFVMACDPSLSRSDATEVAKALAGSISGISGSTEKNGITYLLAGIDERIMFRAVIG